MTVTEFLLIAILIIASVAGKAIGVRLVDWILKCEKGGASVNGWPLQTMALVAIIFGNDLIERGASQNDALTACLLIVLGITMRSTSMVAARFFQMQAWCSSSRPRSVRRCTSADRGRASAQTCVPMRTRWPRRHFRHLGSSWRSS